MNLFYNLNSLKNIPSDINEHLMTIYHAVKFSRAKRVVELGVKSGLSTQALLAGVVENEGFLYSYDIYEMQNDVPPVEANLLNRFNPELLKELEKYWQFKIKNSLDGVYDFSWDDPTIDLLFIDTDHKPDQIYKELTLWTPMVKENGFVLMHDIAVPQFNLNSGIERFIKEDDGNWQYDQYQNNNGLGILYRK